MFVGLLAAASIVRLGIALLLPQLRALEKPVATEAITPPNRPDAAELKDLLQPRFLAPVLAGSLLSGSHSVLNGFSPLLWKREGVSEGLIGIYLAVGPIAEIVAMLVAGWWRAGSSGVSSRGG